MSRRRGVRDERVAEIPVLRGLSEQPVFEAVVRRETVARHAFSVCLYREPSYAARFPKRDFAEMYLRADELRAFLVRSQAHLVCFCDEAMLETAVGMNVGEVYVVRTRPRFAWEQHLWRYYAALLPGYEAVKAWHFRGLDNVARDDVAMLERFVSGGYDLLRAPYFRKGRVYTPVRGSCSVAGRGVVSLGRWLRGRNPLPTEAAWPEPFHVDERYLAEWYAAEGEGLDVFTYLDREMGVEFWADLQRGLHSGRRVHVEGRVCDGGPLRGGVLTSRGQRDRDLLR